MQSFTQILGKKLGPTDDDCFGKRVGFTSPQNNNNTNKNLPTVRVLRKASSMSILSEDDDYEDLVADETEEIQPS